jgi:hypothetical protein
MLAMYCEGLGWLRSALNSALASGRLVFIVLVQAIPAGCSGDDENHCRQPGPSARGIKPALPYCHYYLRTCGHTTRRNGGQHLIGIEYASDGRKQRSMNEISRELAEKPNEVVESSDDEQIKGLLLELGILSQFTRTPQGPKLSIQAVPYIHHPTHFILVALWLGYDDPTQNGYRVWCIPKSEADIRIFQAFCKEVLPNQVFKSEIFFSGPGKTSN